MAPGPTRPVRGWTAAPVAALLLAATATGCGLTGDRPTPLPTAHTAPQDSAGARVGILSVGTPRGPRACTASVVHSPQRNLLVTAAHCVMPDGLGLQQNLMFTPGYRNGQAPYGSWPVKATTVDPRWDNDADPEYDVAFLTVAAVGGRQIEDAVGGNNLGNAQGFGLSVAVTGYPNGGEEPVTCAARTSSQSPTQERFDCDGYAVGTSGSPWITAGGEVIGVIGGYQEGGDSPRTSYSITFDDRVVELYRRATGG